MAEEVWELLSPAFGDAEKDVPQIDVVDIGANPIDGDPPYRLLLDAGLCRVTGFEPQLGGARRTAAGRPDRTSGTCPMPSVTAAGTPCTCARLPVSPACWNRTSRQLELLIDFPRWLGSPAGNRSTPDGWTTSTRSTGSIC